MFNSKRFILKRNKIFKRKFVYLSIKEENMRMIKTWEATIWNGIFHPEIESATNISLEQKKNLQFILDIDFDGNFIEMMENMLTYAVDVEEYESAAEIRDYLKE